MSLYTTKYLDILRNYALPEKNQTFDALIDSTYDKFFNFDFPWYAPSDVGKNEFKKLFLLHYLMYEIGQETIELHRAMLASRLREIMPYYAGVYESLNIDMDWIRNVDMSYTEDATTDESTKDTRTVDASLSGTTSDTTTGNSSGTSNNQNQNIDSDNPQVNFSGTDYASSMSRGETKQTVSNESSTTATGKTSNTEDRKEEGTGTKNAKLDSDRTEKGYRGVNRWEVVKGIRDSIYNINMEIIDRCSDLFMLIY